MVRAGVEWYDDAEVSLGKIEDATIFEKRASNYRNVRDKAMPPSQRQENRFEVTRCNHLTSMADFPSESFHSCYRT